MFFDHRGGKVFLKKSSEATRPGGCWTIKENSLFSHIPPIIKFRPITAHNAHPQFYEDSALRLVCLFLLLLLRCANDFRTICQSGKHIRGMCSSFCGSFERQKKNVAAMAELDVMDCFLITPRALVLPALHFWFLVFSSENRRRHKILRQQAMMGRSQDNVGRTVFTALLGDFRQTHSDCCCWMGVVPKLPPIGKQSDAAIRQKGYRLVGTFQPRMLN